MNSWWLAAAVLFAAACSDPVEVEPTPTTEAVVHVARAPGFDSEIVRLAVLADLSGDGRAAARRWLAGVEVVWAELNAGGGLGGRFPVELVVRDHGGNPDAAAAHYRELRDSVLAIAVVDGDAAVAAVAPEAAEDGLLMVSGHRALADWSRPAVLTAGSPREVATLAVLEHLGEGPIWCGVVDGSQFGLDASRVLPVAAELAGQEPPVMLAVDSERPLADALAVANDQGCRVWLATTAASAEVYLAGVAEGAVVALDARLGALLSIESQAPANGRLVFGVDGPEWSDGSPGMAALLDAVGAHAPDVLGDRLLAEGYTSQLFLRAVLEEATARADLRRAAIELAAQELETPDFAGLVSDVHPLVGEPPTSVRIYERDLDGDPTGWRFVAPVDPAAAPELLNRLS